MNQLKVGDVVKLKSGGPEMTVYSVSESKPEVWCVWFPSGDYKEKPLQDVFQAEALDGVR